ncbi:hypothetical protein [Flavobacterium johnsoniae]|uniref:hypothetical protein n=1 Tax=Flavobacterium johnsoniae TaxID=986 RepID=UPI00006E96AB|nr:hypothetical protein [Flavobacterium johnsoniae]WQG82520.1 hypothetical protein SR927_05255 [Flavobacterium johnsoniae UW101]
MITDTDGEIHADFSFLTAASVLFDAVYIPDGLGLSVLADSDEVNEFLNDAYKHCKVIGADGRAEAVLSAASFASKITNEDKGIVIAKEAGTEKFAADFIAAMGKHRFWEREPNLYN